MNNINGTSFTAHFNKLNVVPTIIIITYLNGLMAFKVLRTRLIEGLTWGSSAQHRFIKASIAIVCFIVSASSDMCENFGRNGTFNVAATLLIIS